MKLKIAHVVVTPVMAGAQKISFDILSRLPEDKYDRFLICGLDQYVINETFFSRFEQNGVKIIKLPSLKRDIGSHDLTAFFDLLKIFRQHKFDIVHTHSTKAGIVARIAAKLTFTPKVIHTVHGISFHALESKTKRTIYYIIELFSSLFSDEIITVNKFYTKFYKFIPFVRLKSIYNGVDFSKFKSYEPTKKEENNINVLYMSRMDVQKNPFFLLHAIKKLVDENSLACNVNFRFVGDGPLKSKCVDYVRDNSLERVVNFSGWTDNVSLEYSNADIFCVPSNYEAFGLVFIESAFFSVPVISTCVEGIPEVVLDNKTGLLCKPNDVEALSKLLLTLIDDERLRGELGKNAKNYCLNFTVDTMVAQYMSSYTS